MNASANAQPVDVLAVMDRAAPIIGNSDHGDAYAVLTMLPEARDAVAELVEAARALIGRFDFITDKQLDAAASGRIIIPRLSGVDVRALIATRAALARVGGAP